MNLFAFRYAGWPNYRILILANDPAAAADKLEAHLRSHPQLPGFDEWHESAVLGKINDNVFTLDTAVI